MDYYRIKSLEQYFRHYRKSVKKPDFFWEQVAANFTWRKPWDKVFHTHWEKAEFRWFENGKLNITENCLDRHLARERGGVRLPRRDLALARLARRGRGVERLPDRLLPPPPPPAPTPQQATPGRAPPAGACCAVGAGGAGGGSRRSSRRSSTFSCARSSTSPSRSVRTISIALSTRSRTIPSTSRPT